MVVEDRHSRIARLKLARPMPRWMLAKLSRRRKAAVVGREQGPPEDPPKDRPMDIEALFWIVRSVADEGFGSGPKSLEARLCEQSPPRGSGRPRRPCKA